MKLDLADDEHIPYVSDCDWCGKKCFDDTGYCKKCTIFIKEEEEKDAKAASLMEALGIEHYELSHLMEDGRVVYIRQLYDIFSDKEKLKEFIFKLKNKAFL